MALHQRIAKIKTMEEVYQLQAELEDIYGKPPEPVERLLHGLRIRVRAHEAGMDIVSLTRNKGYLRYHISQSEKLDPLRILQLDGRDGLKLLVTTKGENVAIEINDSQKRGDLSERIIPLLDALESPTPPPPLEQKPSASTPPPAQKQPPTVPPKPKSSPKLKRFPKKFR